MASLHSAKAPQLQARGAFTSSAKAPKMSVASRAATVAERVRDKGDADGTDPGLLFALPITETPQ
jgi:hypothetical protein